MFCAKSPLPPCPSPFTLPHNSHQNAANPFPMVGALIVETARIRVVRWGICWLWNTEFGNIFRKRVACGIWVRETIGLFGIALSPFWALEADLSAKRKFPILVLPIFCFSWQRAIFDWRLQWGRLWGPPFFSFLFCSIGLGNTSICPSSKLLHCHTEF